MLELCCVENVLSIALRSHQSIFSSAIILYCNNIVLQYIDFSNPYVLCVLLHSSIAMWVRIDIILLLQPYYNSCIGQAKRISYVRTFDANFTYSANHPLQDLRKKEQIRFFATSIMD